MIMYWRVFPVGSKHISVGFYFVKPHDVPPLLCFNLQIEMRFGVEQLLFTTPTPWKQELFYSKSHFNLYVKAKQRRHTVLFHKHKIQLKYVKIQLEMLSTNVT